jgi:RNA polymerase sigma-70 factor (ECF subfamily)
MASELAGGNQVTQRNSLEGHTLSTAAETDLVVRAQRGDENAFASLYELHKRNVYSLCLRMMRSPADAEDLTQEAFLSVFRKIKTFRGESAFSTWLHRLVVNAVLAQLRKKRLPNVSLEEFNVSLGETVTLEYRDDDRRLMATVDRITLAKAIALLPPRYRTVLVLFDLQGYCHTEIARIMNWSVGNSKSQLHKARRTLLHRLRPGSNALVSMRRAKANSKTDVKPLPQEREQLVA